MLRKFCVFWILYFVHDCCAMRILWFVLHAHITHFWIVAHALRELHIVGMLSMFLFCATHIFAYKLFWLQRMRMSNDFELISMSMYAAWFKCCACFMHFTRLGSARAMCMVWNVVYSHGECISHTGIRILRLRDTSVLTVRACV